MQGILGVLDFFTVIPEQRAVYGEGMNAHGKRVGAGSREFAGTCALEWLILHCQQHSSVTNASNKFEFNRDYQRRHSSILG